MPLARTHFLESGAQHKPEVLGWHPGLVVSSENSPHNATQDGVWPLIEWRGPGIPWRPGCPLSGTWSHWNGKSHHRSTWESVVSLYYKNLSQNACALIAASKNRVCRLRSQKTCLWSVWGAQGLGVQV